MSDRSPTLVCFALKEEATPFRKRLGDRSAVTILITGIGRKNTERALVHFLNRATPQQVFTCGFTGGLNPDLPNGAVVFASANQALTKRLALSGAQAGQFACVDRIAITAAEKAALRANTGADAVEMESEVVQQLCAKRNIPCATVRAVSDTAQEDLPLDFNALSKPDHSLDFGKLAWAIAKSPGKITKLLQLQKNSSRAAEQLAEVLLKALNS